MKYGRPTPELELRERMKKGERHFKCKNDEQYLCLDYKSLQAALELFGGYKKPVFHLVSGGFVDLSFNKAGLRY